MLERQSRLIAGMDQISEFFGLEKPKSTRLAAQGLLPGVFKMGRGYFCDPSVADEAIKAKARSCEGGKIKDAP